jgi:thymidylate synthase
MQTENEYLRVLKKVMDEGAVRADRTGTGVLGIFGEQMTFDISESVPLLTTKFVPWKSCVKELLWFCRGDTDAKVLSAQGVKIWDMNSSRKFLDARGLTHLPEGDVGKMYGHQWRRSGAEYVDCKTPAIGEGVDQLAYVLDLLKNDPTSRRIVMNSWVPKDLPGMAICPCHVGAQFYVDNDRRLSCHMYQRSCDMFLGVPWNILSYSVLTYVLAKKADLKPHRLIVSMGDVHVYRDHVDQVREQLSREPYDPPALAVADSVRDKDWADITVDDFAVAGYVHHPAIRANMSA